MPYTVPVAMSKKDIQDVVNDYSKAAENALKAGFDGVGKVAMHLQPTNPNQLTRAFGYDGVFNT